MRRTKIVATIGPASSERSLLAAMARAGMDVARLNFSHTSRDEFPDLVARLRSVARQIDIPLALLADLQGPKIRTGRLKDRQPVKLVKGSLLEITAEPIEGDDRRISVDYAGLPCQVRAGDRILLDDGQIALEVIETDERSIKCRALEDGLLGEHKGVNVPGANLQLPALTEKDRRDLELALEHEVDFLALSFVRSAQDIIAARRLIGKKPVQLVAKIEKPEAVENIDSILEASDAVMVARGDLGVEAPPEQIPLMQKMIIDRAIAAGRAVITATQMLESMRERPRPTRAEASDVANAILDGTDAVMLSAETATGKYPVESVAMMARIAEAAERKVAPRHIGPKPADNSLFTHAVAHAAVSAAEELRAAAIVVYTVTGSTARIVSSFRPRQPIIAFTPEENSYRQLALVWGVRPLVIEFKDQTDLLVMAGERRLLESGLVNAGETIVSISGITPLAGATNVMRVSRLGARNS